MSDHMKLRIAAGNAIARGDRCITVDTIYTKDLVALIDAVDGLPKPKTKSADYPPEFEAAYGACKWRQGSTRAAAYKAWKARIVAGASPAELLAGAEKYGRYCAATGCEVKMAQTFFGPGEHFTADWTVRTAPSNLGKAGQATARAAMDWMGSE
jgi:hypothetical protein